MNVCAQETQPEGGSGGQIDLRRENDQSSVLHTQHRVPTNRVVPLSAYYNSYAGTLTFSSMMPINFVYGVYDEDGFIVSQGTVNLEEEQDTTIPLPTGVEGECTITLEINGQTYSGCFYVQNYEW